MDPVDGGDGNPGTKSEPLRTLREAASRAESSHTIWLLRGPFTSVTEQSFDSSGRDDDRPCGDAAGIRFADGVSLRAVDERVRLVIAGEHGLCARGGAFSGLIFERATPYGPCLELDGGSVELEGLSFSTYEGDLSPDVSWPASLVLKGSADVRWVAGAYELGVGPLASLEEESRLHVSGGSAELVPGDPAGYWTVFALTGNSALELDGTALTGRKDLPTSGVFVNAGETSAPSVRIANTTIDGFSWGVRVLYGGSVTVLDSHFRRQRFAGIHSFTRPGGPEVHTVHVERSFFSESGVGLIVPTGHVVVDVLDSEFTQNDRGIVVTRNAGSFTMARTHVTGSAGIGVMIGAAGAHVRASTIARNGEFGLSLQGVTHADLGTLREPGENVWVDNGRTSATEIANVHVACTEPCRVSAVGNQWNANEQGADEAGHYVSSGSNTEVTSGDGKNYRVTNGTLLLAE